MERGVELEKGSTPYSGVEHVDSTGGKHFPQLDSLRAIAIGLVMIEHYSRGIAKYIPTEAGSLGVNLFFVLSGYLIMGGLLRECQRGGSASSILFPFFIKRTFRLFPIYYLVLVVFSIFSIERVTHGIWWHVTYASNMYPSFGGNSTIFWSLAVEEQFYLFLPLVVFVGSLQGLEKRLWTLLGVCVIYKVLMVLVFGSFNWRTLPASAEPLIVGCILSIRLLGAGRESLLNHEMRFLRVAAFISAAAATIIWLVSAHIFRNLFNPLLNGIFCAYAIYYAMHFETGVVYKMLMNKYVRYFGKISYGVYLVHSFVPDAIRGVFPGINDFSLGLTTFPVVLIVCAVSYHFFERPVLNIGYNFAKRAKKSLA